MPTPHRTMPCRATDVERGGGGAGAGGGGPRLTRLRGQQVRYSNLSARSPTSYLSRRMDMGAILARQISAHSVQIYASCYCAQQSIECSIVECLGRCLPGRPCLVTAPTRAPAQPSWAGRSPRRPLPRPRPAPPNLVDGRRLRGRSAGLGKLQAGRPAVEEEVSKLGRSTDILHGTLARSSPARPRRRGYYVAGGGKGQCRT